MTVEHTPLYDPHAGFIFAGLATIPPTMNGICVVCRRGPLSLDTVRGHTSCVPIGKLALEFLEAYSSGLLERSNFRVELEVRDRHLVFIGSPAKRRELKKRKPKPKPRKARSRRKP